MRKLLAGLLVAGLATFAGCNKSEPGGPGATPGSKKYETPSSPRASATPASPRADGDGAPKNVTVDKKTRFTIGGPGLGLTSTDVKQGATETVKLKLDRGENFKETIKLSFKDDKEGLKFEANPATVTPGDKDEVQVKVTADDKAAIGKHTVIVTATPSAGETATHEFTVNVKAK